MPDDSTRTMLFGMFVLAGRKMSAGQVIELAQPLGISATNVKSHLTRMVAEGALRRSGPVRRAQYWPSSSQINVVEGITARLRGNQVESWDGSWLVLALELPSNRQQRERLRALLWFDGFRSCAPGTFIRPAWPRQWAQGRAELHLARMPGLCVCGSPIGSMSVDQVRSLYDLDLLDREAHRLARRIARTQTSGSTAAHAFAIRIKIGGLVARLVGHDPRLPMALWSRRNGMRELIHTFRRFEARIAPISQRFLDQVFHGRGERK